MAFSDKEFLLEGMAAIHAFLEQGDGAQGASAARELANIMKDLHFSPLSLDRAETRLRRFRERYPEEAASHLQKTLAWVDR